ncbi:acetaldehyde dehydrogenase [Scopulibacillus darangshiensis]|uniref:Acetaldehyde dehydrogenase n=1 Tax=Scopulibacillus darangshiensis TaxID=442528 RepID=A0A4R2P9G3_9BACL|nr:acetaldehyde dehydrogenase (acetylating) [Scopulibacillus darangshiensis]TCP31547.1 acetaldehyde dehydrogenase [Scopulibacillus darangshiensis]
MMLDKDLSSVQEVRSFLKTAHTAQKKLEKMTQNQIDRLIQTMSDAAKNHAYTLAEMAVYETGYGKAEDKLTKNLFAANTIYDAIKDKKTVGIINRDENNRVWEIAQPVGVIAGIVPSTNPTSTVIFKALIAVKAGNAIVFSPHPSAAKCTSETAKILQQAASQAGAPDGLITCVTQPSLAAANELMTHQLTNVILATGGSGMVKAAYSSGKPAYGVGPGNVPVYIHSSADVQRAVHHIVESKTFDNGTICSSEQAIVVDKKIKRKVKEEFKRKGVYFLDDHEKKQVASIILINGSLNPKIVGKSPQAIAEMAGILVPPSAKALIAEEESVGKDYPFSVEKLAPILALYTVENWETANRFCEELLKLGGLGHSMGIHAEDQQIIEKFGLEKHVSRLIVNAGTTFGGIGATTGLQPSMTLGCGSFGNNITSDNIGPQHLMNIKRLAFGIQEMEKEEPAIPRQQSNSNVTISKEEVAQIVKSVLQEMQF